MWWRGWQKPCQLRMSPNQPLHCPNHCNLAVLCFLKLWTLPAKAHPPSPTTHAERNNVEHSTLRPKPSGTDRSTRWRARWRADRPAWPTLGCSRSLQSMPMSAAGQLGGSSSPRARDLRIGGAGGGGGVEGRSCLVEPLGLQGLGLKADRIRIQLKGLD